MYKIVERKARVVGMDAPLAHAVSHRRAVVAPGTNGASGVRMGDLKPPMLEEIASGHTCTPEGHRDGCGGQCQGRTHLAMTMRERLVVWGLAALILVGLVFAVIGWVGLW
jgi:hypothetical protein